MKTLRAALLCAALTLTAGAAAAHPQLTASTPAPNSTVGSSNRIELHFSEPLMLRFSGADLTMTTMMMNGRMTAMPMRINGVTAALAPGDPKTLVITTQQPLAVGGYRLNWHAVASDTHRVTGTLNFTVR